MNHKLFFGAALLLAAPLLFACGSVKTDSEVMAGVKAIASGCDIEVRYGWAKNCKAGEKDRFLKLMDGKLKTDLGRVAALGTLATALHSKDEKIQAVAADRLYDNFRDFGHFGKNPKLMTPALADKLLSGVASVKGYVAFYAARSAAHAAVLSNKTADLYKTVESHPEKAVRYEAFRHMMVYGRLKVLPKIKELVASADQQSQVAGSYAPISMYDWTDAEKKEICPWGKTLLQHQTETVAQNAANFLSMRCGGEYIDAVLNEAESRLKAGTLKPPFSYALTHSTFSCKSFLGSKPQGTPEQCKRREDLAKKIPKAK